jgi:prepilin-type N-terminal cleavage/methylation domain-containing protein
MIETATGAPRQETRPPAGKEIPGKALAVPSGRLVEGGRKMEERGFTFIESLVVVAIIGLLLIVSYPSIQNALQVRKLENEARQVLTSFQQAKFQAARVKLNHRVRFDNSAGQWVYLIERETQDGTWHEPPGSVRNSISSRYAVIVNFPSAVDGSPGQVAVFSPFGSVENYDVNSLFNVSLQDNNLTGKGQPGVRSIWVYAGGSTRYEKST